MRLQAQPHRLVIAHDMLAERHRGQLRDLGLPPLVARLGARRTAANRAPPSAPANPTAPRAGRASIERNASASASRSIAATWTPRAAAQILDRWRKARPRAATSRAHRPRAARRSAAGRGAAPTFPSPAAGGVGGGRVERANCPSPSPLRPLPQAGGGGFQRAIPLAMIHIHRRAPRPHARAHRGRSAPARKTPSAAS